MERVVDVSRMMRVFEVACGNVEKGAPVVSSVAGNGFGWCEIGP